MLHNVFLFRRFGDGEAHHGQIIPSGSDDGYLVISLGNIFFFLLFLKQQRSPTDALIYSRLKHGLTCERVRAITH